MGMYRITVEAVGGHGCQRKIKDGGVVLGCGNMGCPDCIARQFVASLQQKGNDVSKAILEHWPETPETVVDDLLTHRRKGSF